MKISSIDHELLLKLEGNGYSGIDLAKSILGESKYISPFLMGSISTDKIISGLNIEIAKNDDLISTAIEIAKEAHKDQKRWDGTPYIYHPIMVANIALDFYLRETEEPNFTDANNILITAIGHDLEEDTKVSAKEYVEFLAKKGLTAKSQLLIFQSLNALNKNFNPNYLEFTLAAKKYVYSRYVKRADLTHNVSDIKKGSMKDKYLMALYILENE